MLIHTGLGFVVLASTIVCEAITIPVADYVSGNEYFAAPNVWPTSLWLFMAAGICYYLGRYFERQKVKVEKYIKSSHYARTPENHTFFFIPVLMWAYVFGLCGMGIFIWGVFFR
jgi:hypothetical protein